MKVAYILHRFPVLSETFIMRELHWIRRHGIDVTIFALLPGTDKLVHDQAQELLGLTHYSPFLSRAVVRAQAHFLRRSPGRYMTALAGVIRQTWREPLVMLRGLLLFPKSVYFAQRIQTLGIEHIHAHFVWVDGLAAGVAADLLHLPFSLHSHAFDLYQRNPHNVRQELQHASQVVTISEYNRRYIAQLCPAMDPSQVEVVYCGVDTAVFQPEPKQAADGILRVISVGRLIEKKGMVYLIEACKQLVDRGLAIECRIVGEGPLHSSLQARIEQLGLQPHVTLLGALAQDEVRRLIQAGDVMVLAATVAASGDQDGIPIVLMEAMACGLPVVTTPVSGIPELVVDGQTGLLTQERSPSELADALEKLACDDGLRQRLGSQARAMVVSRFDLRQNSAKLASIFHRVAKRHATPVQTAVQTADHPFVQPTLASQDDAEPI